MYNYIHSAFDIHVLIIILIEFGEALGSGGEN